MLICHLYAIPQAEVWVFEETTRPRRMGKMRSHVRLEDLPAEMLLQLGRPRRMGKMVSHLTSERLDEFS